MITWESGDSNEKLLSDDPEDFDIEKLKYIPQQFHEILFNSEKSEDFEAELKKVIFSHISEPDKLGKPTLDDLIKYKKE